MTNYLSSLNTPPITGRARWFLIGQRVLGAVLALSFLLLGLGRFGASSFPRPTDLLQPYSKSASSYLKQLLDRQLKTRGLVALGANRAAAVVTEDRWLTLWDLPSTKRIQLFYGDHDQFTAAAFAPEQNLAVTGGHDATLNFWDVPTGGLCFTLKAHEKTISALAFAPGGETLASGGADSEVKLWNVKTGETLARFDTYLGWVLALTFAADGQSFASAGSNHKVQLYRKQKDGKWENTQWKNTLMLLNSRAAVVALSFTPDGQTLAAANLAGDILIWDLAAGVLRKTITLSQEVAYALAFSPNGEWLASGSSAGMVRVWSAAGELRFERHGHAGEVRALNFTANGAQLMSAETGTKLWQMPNGEPRQAANITTVQYWQMTEGEKLQTVNLTP